MSDLSAPAPPPSAAALVAGVLPRALRAVGPPGRRTSARCASPRPAPRPGRSRCAGASIAPDEQPRPRGRPRARRARPRLGPARRAPRPRPPARAARRPGDGRLAVPMHAIVKFLEFPLQGWARFRVGPRRDRRRRSDGARRRAVRDRRPRGGRVPARGAARVGRAAMLARAGVRRGGARPRAPRRRALGGLRARRARASPRDARGVARRARGARRADRRTRGDSLRARRRARARRQGVRRGRPRRGRRRRRGRRARHARRDWRSHAAAGRAARRRRSRSSSGRSRSGTTSGSRPSAIARCFALRRPRAAQRLRRRRGRAARVAHRDVDAGRAGRASEWRSRPCRATRRPSGCAAWCASCFRGRTRTSSPARRSSCTRAQDPEGPVGPWLEKARDVLGDARRRRWRCAPRTARCRARRTIPPPDEDRARAMIAARFGAFFRKTREAAVSGAQRVVRPAVLRRHPAGPARRHRGVGRDGQDVHAREPRRRAGPLDRPDDRPPALRDLHREGDPRASRARPRQARGAPRGPGRAADRRADPRRRLLDDRRRGRKKLERALHAFDARPSPPSTPSASACCARTPSRAAAASRSGRSTDARPSGARCATPSGARSRAIRRAPLARGGAAERLVHRAASRSCSGTARASARRAAPGVRRRRRSTRPSRRSRSDEAREPAEPGRAQGVGRARGGRRARSPRRCRTWPISSSSARDAADAPLVRARGEGRRRASCASGCPRSAPRPGRAAARRRGGPRARAGHAAVRGRHRARAARRRSAASSRAASAPPGATTSTTCSRWSTRRSAARAAGALAEAMRRALALRAHRRVPGHRRDAVVDLPARVLRARRGPTPERAARRRRSEAVDLPVSRRRRGHLPRGAATRCSRPAARASGSTATTARPPRSSRRTNALLRPGRARADLHGRRRLRAGHVRASRPHARRRRRDGRRRPCAPFDSTASLSLAHAGRVDRAGVARASPTRRGPGGSTAAPLDYRRRLRPHAHRARGARDRRGAPGRRRAARVLQGGGPLPDRRGEGSPRPALRHRRPGRSAARRLAAWLTPFFGAAARGGRARARVSRRPIRSAARLYAWKALADARDFDRLFQSIVRDSGIVRREIFFADGERDLTNTSTCSSS